MKMSLATRITCWLASCFRSRKPDILTVEELLLMMDIPVDKLKRIGRRRGLIVQKDMIVQYSRRLEMAEISRRGANEPAIVRTLECHDFWRKAKLERKILYCSTSTNEFIAMQAWAQASGYTVTKCKSDEQQFLKGERSFTIGQRITRRRNGTVDRIWFFATDNFSQHNQ